MSLNNQVDREIAKLVSGAKIRDPLAGIGNRVQEEVGQLGEEVRAAIKNLAPDPKEQCTFGSAVIKGVSDTLSAGARTFLNTLLGDTTPAAPQRRPGCPSR